MIQTAIPLTTDTLSKALTTLSAHDKLIARLFAENGVPPLWSRAQNFDTFVHIILEQKVSLQSAQAVLDRVRAICNDMSPEHFLEVPDQLLRQAGISERKLSYCRSIAEALIDYRLDLASLNSQTDDEVISTLVAIRGIGPWTAGVYLMMAMRRPDAWASGDRALQVSYAEQMGLDDPPSYAELDAIALQWQPHRASVARLLWHAYLLKRGTVF